MSYLHAETNDRCDDCTSNVESLALSLPFIVGGGGGGTGGGGELMIYELYSPERFV